MTMDGNGMENESHPVERISARTFPVEKFLKLEDPARREWFPTAPVIDALTLAAGARVADIGAGTGYFAVPLAEAVGATGIVYAVDMQQPMLDFLREKLQKLGTPNITCILGTSGATGLERASVDLAFYCNVWHEIHEPQRALAEATRILAPGGRIAILDWRSDVANPPGPPQDHRVSSASLEKMLGETGWQQIAARPSGNFHYLVTATRPGK